VKEQPPTFKKKEQVSCFFFSAHYTLRGAQDDLPFLPSPLFFSSPIPRLFFLTFCGEPDSPVIAKLFIVALSTLLFSATSTTLHRKVERGT
jgi:hypothetical protein